MTRFEVLVEGPSDVPAVREVLVRRFGLTENEDFRIHPHQGKGSLPTNLKEGRDPTKRGLLNQLPSKLRGYATYLSPNDVVLVVIDADDSPVEQLVTDLNVMLDNLSARPERVLFQLAIEETESWFIADIAAVQTAFPKAKVAPLRKIPPDAIVGAWEELAKAIGSTGSSGTDKRRWAEKICPHLNLDNPPSPSFQRLISGIAGELAVDHP